jgi:hypothetical protein
MEFGKELRGVGIQSKISQLPVKLNALWRLASLKCFPNSKRDNRKVNCSLLMVRDEGAMICIFVKETKRRKNQDS